MTYSQNIHLLCLAEHQLDRKLFSEYAKVLRWDITLAENLPDAVESAKRVVFDVLLIDFDLSDRSGILAIEQIVESSALNCGSPSILFTTNCDPDVTSGAEGHGVAEILEKPVHIETFRDAVSNALAFDTPPALQWQEQS